MRRSRRLRSFAAWFAKALVTLLAFLVVTVALALVVLETGWAKNQIRKLIVRQANQYLTADLAIGSLGGSILRGIELGDIRLSREGQTLIAIDHVALRYSPRELWENGTAIRSITLTRPHFFVGRQPDGRWNIAALVKRDVRQQERSGPSRPIHILKIAVEDGSVVLGDPLEFGAAHVPSRFDRLNVACSFDYEPVKWRLNFANASWTAPPPDLTVTRLHGLLDHGPGGWLFDTFFVETPQTTFTIGGRINKEEGPTSLDLHVRADRFAFQEWAVVLHGLKNIAVNASFDTRLTGPVNRLQTDLQLAGTGGAIRGALVLDTTIPGWHGKGAVDIDRLNLARWLNRTDRPSDITGHVAFDLDLDLGRHFPRGSYSFVGPHAGFMEYAADNVRAKGVLTARDAVVNEATASAYRAGVTIDSGSIGLDDPFPFRFEGTMRSLDLREVPASVPVPRVESTLAFTYDVSGRFSHAFIAGHATFDRSIFLGATIEAGTIGSIDTSATPLTFSGDGVIEDVSLRRFGEGLDVGWMRDPRYAGTVSGRFHVDGAGTDRATLSLRGGGRISRARLFNGSIGPADVSIEIADGSLSTSFNGPFASIDPAIALADSRFAGSLTGSANVRVGVRDVLTRTSELDDYDLDGEIDLNRSSARGFDIAEVHAIGALHEGLAHFTRLNVTAPALEGQGSGTVAFREGDASDFDYSITRADLAALKSSLGDRLQGQLTTTGRMTGLWTALQFEGSASVSRLEAPDIGALTTTGTYRLTIPSGDTGRMDGRVEAHAAFPTIFGERFEEACADVTIKETQLSFDLQAVQAPGRTGTLTGATRLDVDHRRAELGDLTISIGSMPWRLVQSDPLPTVAWGDDRVTLSPMAFVNGSSGSSASPAGSSADQRIDLAGDWRPGGGGALHVKASRVSLETLAGAFEQPPRYGGVLDLDATFGGSRRDPTIDGELTITSGTFNRFAYEKLAGRVKYTNGAFDIDFRLDQSPGVWLTAAGSVPYAVFNRDLPERDINVAIKSSPIGLGLVEGVTDVVRNVTGQVTFDVQAVGTSRDPHFRGSVTIANAGFLVTASGSQYKNGRATFRLAPDQIGVETLHIEDSSGRDLELKGSLGTHELRVGDVHIDGTARRFEVLRNEFGRITIDATLQVRGRFETPRLTGDVTVNGGELRVDDILDRALFQPYATAPTALNNIDAIAALNPWQRLGLDLALHVPQNLRLVGEDVQITPGTPIGLGNINMRVGGDLYFYKDPAQPLYVTGSLDSIAGQYTFQGRRFDIDQSTSSINFRGDSNPEVYVAVTRLISGVLTRVAILGPLRNPELRLTSTPPLDSSDILSLIVFNTTTNELSASQQQELAVRAGTLAASFLATPIVSAIESELGLESLQVEPGDFGTGAKITVGQEIWPGLVARFSRQFGPEPYDEATIEYYLSRLLRLRATFSDAATLNSRAPFRRVERAGIDLLLFFSF